MVSRTCPAKVCPAPPRVSRREPPVLDEDVGRIDLAEFGNDAVDLFLVAVDDQPEAGLLDHNTFRYLVGTDPEIRRSYIERFNDHVFRNGAHVGRHILGHRFTSLMYTVSRSFTFSSFWVSITRPIRLVPSNGSEVGPKSRFADRRTPTSPDPLQESLVIPRAAAGASSFGGFSGMSFVPGAMAGLKRTTSSNLKKTG